MKGTRNVARGFVICVLLVVAGCVSTPTVPVSTNGEWSGLTPGRERPRIALVLGGGAARGFAHIGVIRVLEQEKIPVDLVVGTSVGSLIGALYAHHGDSFELEWTAYKLEYDDIFDYTVFNSKMGPVTGERLERFVRETVPLKNIEALKLPFAAVATDLYHGDRVILDRGDLARSVRASCSIPGIFQPVKFRGHLLVDGGVVDNIPIDVARERGADLVIAVDISRNVTNYNITNAVDVTLQAVWIMFKENVAQQRKDADILISPAVDKIAMLDFSKKKEAMLAGMSAAREAVPAIREAMIAWQRANGVVGSANP